MPKVSKKNATPEYADSPSDNALDKDWATAAPPPSDDLGHANIGAGGGDEDGMAYTVSKDLAPEPLTLGVSSEGPFVAPEGAVFIPPPVQPPDNTDQRFEAFKEDLFKLCYRHGFVLVGKADSTRDHVFAFDVKGDKSRLKRVRRVSEALQIVELAK